MKIILQPLIENSIVHGFTSNSKNNRIHIHAYEHRANLHIDVKDNGIGIDKKKVEQSLLDNGKKQDNFALKNIHDRLANVFGENFGLNIIENNKEGGTFIKIILPLVYSQEEAEQYILKEGDQDA
ncbi:sensor histidine kinase [Sinobaca sp. H24]|uniref:sensor histidine kinase n=1 Tax=Sinobaca sp. H24 TaxID=2923376 RepID=UPI00207A528E|nr:ATP-binding protein [Sinobaca sp. H24]